MTINLNISEEELKNLVYSINKFDDIIGRISSDAIDSYNKPLTDLEDELYQNIEAIGYDKDGILNKLDNLLEQIPGEIIFLINCKNAINVHMKHIKKYHDIKYDNN